MKQLPNVLSGLRILLAIGLLLIPPLGLTFYVLYLICGLTDILDGALARRLQAESSFGSRLDSFADFLLVCILLWLLIPVIVPSGVVLIWVVGIGLLRLLAACTARIRFGRWCFLHTWGNKLTGGLLFLYPLSLCIVPSGGMQYTLCSIATLTAIEELLIELTSKTWNANRKTIFLPEETT
jgi:CDP-diacylglycerol--glycerol-3-phosphate 3-phosphatidyltransferase